MKAVEQIFEDYKAAHIENTKMSECQYEALEEMSAIVASHEDTEARLALGQLFDAGVNYGREAEKNGFIVGFNLAMGLVLNRDIEGNN